MYVLACLLSSCPVTFSANIHLYTHISPAFIHVHALPLPHHLYTYMLLSSICTHTGAYIHLYNTFPHIYLYTYMALCIYLYTYFPLHPFIHVHAPPHHYVHTPAFIYTCTASIYTCPCICLYMYMPLNPFIYIHAPASIYTHTCHCAHLYTYMALHPFIHIHAPAPVYTHTCHCTCLYTSMPLSFDTFYLLSHPSGFISVPRSGLLLLKCYHLMIPASSLCISITPCMLALVFI